MLMHLSYPLFFDVFAGIWVVVIGAWVLSPSVCVRVVIIVVSCKILASHSLGLSLCSKPVGCSCCSLALSFEFESPAD